jgi:hypothetical protein
MAQVVMNEPLVRRTDEQTVVEWGVDMPEGRSHSVQYVLPSVGVDRQQCIDAMFVIGRLVAMNGGWEATAASAPRTKARLS